MESALQKLHANCVQEMVAKTCFVMQSASSSSFKNSGALVFVAGVGPLDADAYGQIYAAGDAMCGVVRDACAMNWNAAQCLTARKLFSGKP